MTSLLYESDADIETVASLMRHIVKLLSKRSESMGEVLVKVNGQIKKAVAFEDVSREDIVKAIESAKQEVVNLTHALEEFDALSATSDSAPADTTAAKPEQPVDLQ